MLRLLWPLPTGCTLLERFRDLRVLQGCARQHSVPAIAFLPVHVSDALPNIALWTRRQAQALQQDSLEKSVLGHVEVFLKGMRIKLQHAWTQQYNAAITHAMKDANERHPGLQDWSWES